VCVCHALIGFAQLDLGGNALSDAGARALVRVLGAARARTKLHVCPDMGPAGATLTTMAFSRLVPPMQLCLPGRGVSTATRGALKRCAPAGTTLIIYWLP